MNRFVNCLLLFALVVAAGCGGTPSSRSANLTGKVLYKGQPVTGGSMTLNYAESSYPVAIRADGTFKAAQLPAGEAIVTIDNEFLNPNKPTYGGGKGPGSGLGKIPEGANQSSGGTYVKLPAKYKDKKTSDVKITLKGGNQDITVELKD
jgi:hypothetical protein